MIDCFSIRLDPKATGARIKQLRKEKNIKVAELAAMMHSSENAIFKWQRGDSIPTIDNLIVLSVIFDTTIDDIIQREGEADGPLLPVLGKKLNHGLYYNTGFWGI